MHTDGFARIYLPPISHGCTHCSLSWNTESHVTISPVGRCSSVFLLPLFLLHLRLARGQVCRCLPAHYPRDVITLRDIGCGIISAPPSKWYPCKATRGNPRRRRTGLQVVLFTGESDVFRNAEWRKRKREIPFAIERYNFARFNSSYNNGGLGKSSRKCFRNLTGRNDWFSLN